MIWPMFLFLAESKLVIDPRLQRLKMLRVWNNNWTDFYRY